MAKKHKRYDKKSPTEKSSSKDDSTALREKAALEKLPKEVQEKLSALGFKQDKPFKPHVTIFRIKNKIGDISDKLNQLTISGNQRISALKFKKSVLSSNGPTYTDLQVIKAKNETNS